MPKYGLYGCMNNEVYDLIQAANWWHEVIDITQDWDFLSSINQKGFIELKYIRLNAITILHRVTTALIEMEEE